MTIEIERPPVGTISNGVMFGGDGFLFPQERQRLRERMTSVEPEFFDFAAKRIQERHDRASSLGARYLAASLPGRAYMMRDIYPIKAPPPLFTHERFGEIGILNLSPWYEPDGPRNFWRTDFHHGPLGNVNAAIGIAENSGLLTEGEVSYIKKLLPGLVRPTGKTYVGELGMRLTPHIGEPEYDFNRVTAAAEVAYDGPPERKHKHPQEGDMVVAETPDALVNATVVVFGTSMVNGLIPPLGHIFSRVIWARTWQVMYWDIVEVAKANLVVSLYSATRLQDIFSHDDADAPAFMDIPNFTGRRLTLRGKFPDVFSRGLPGIMATRNTGKVPGQSWKDLVIGTPGYEVDKFGVRHKVA
jgi:hypothetical protein